MRLKSLLIVAIALFCWTIFLYPQQQIPDIRGKIYGKGGVRIKIALPDFRPQESSVTTISAAQKVHQVLWDDLQFSGIFQMVKKEYYSLISSINEETRINFEDWASIGAEALLVGNVSCLEEKLIVEGRLFDVKTGKMMIGKRYRSEADEHRLIAHTLADEIVRTYTGQKGVANTQIVFVSDREETKEIYLMDYDGYNQRRITYFQSLNLFPAISPDGEAIAFTSYLEENPDLYILGRHGGKIVRLIADLGMSTTPDWSPDGKRLLFTSSRDGNAEIYMAKADGSEVIRLTRNHSIDTSPCWSPTGRQIAFTSDRSGTPQIYIMDAEGTNNTRLTRQGSYNDTPSWSPDGLEIAYASRVGGIFDIFVINLTSKEVRWLTINNGSNENPCWSPGGRHLVFSSNRSGSYQIYTMYPDGSNQKRLTTRGNNTSPRWSRWRE